MFFFPPVQVLAFYTLRNVLMGYAMFFAFAPAHYRLGGRIAPIGSGPDLKWAQRNAYIEMVFFDSRRTVA